MSPSTLRNVHLIPTAFAIPVYVAPEEIAVGQTVFQHFMHDEFQHEGVSDALLIEEMDVNGEGDSDLIDAHFALGHLSTELANTPEGYKSIVISQIGTNIRVLANEFAQSRQRVAVRGEADRVDLGAITYQRFWGLLEEVFRHGVTQHNLIALFFFCSDVLIRCVKAKLRELGTNLFKWSLKFIAERVCRWVHEIGGWEVACKTAIGNTYKVAVFVVTMVAFGWLTYKALKKL